jgi:hypothetical protein
MPLVYSFGYVDDKGVLVALELKRASRSASNVLPAGRADNANIRDTFVSIEDAFGAVTTETISEAVVVMPSTTEGVTDLMTTALATVVTANVTEELTPMEAKENRKMVNMVTTILNTPDCSGVTPAFCAGLNREPCADTSDMCGACLAGFPQGEDRDATSMCEAADVPAPRVPRSCPANCSGHGKCSFYADADSAIIADCFVGDFCAARCVCTDGYTGNACKQTTAELDAAKDLRDNIISTFAATLTLSDESDSEVEARSNAISEMASKPEELSTEAKETILDLALSTMLYAKDGDSELSAESLSGMGDVVDAFFSELSKEPREDSRRLRTGAGSVRGARMSERISRKLQDERAVMREEVNKLVSIVSDLGALKMREMVPGQDSRDTVGENVKQKAVVVVPSLEDGVGRVNSSASALASGRGSAVHIETDSEASVGVSLSEFSYQSVKGAHPELQSNALQLELDGFECDVAEGGDADAKYEFEILNLKPQTYGVVADSVETVVTACTRGTVSNHFIVCNGFEIPVTCDGTSDSLTTTCEVESAPACTTGLFSSSDMMCVASAYDADTTHCRCDVCPAVRRRLQTGTTAGTVSVATTPTVILGTTASIMGMPDDDEDEGSGADSSAAIAGGVAGGLVVLCVAVYFIFNAKKSTKVVTPHTAAGRGMDSVVPQSASATTDATSSWGGDDDDEPV